VKNLEVAPHLRHLYAHLVENKFIEDLTGYRAENLTVYSTDVLEKIHAGDDALATLLPVPIFETIKSRKLFGWGGQ
jgi:hypothetical protein